MKKYLAWLLTIAMVLTLFPATVGATGSTGENAKDLALLEEEMRQALFAADDRKYSEDYVEPETDNPDEIVRVIVEMKAAPALQVASTAATIQAQDAEMAALKSQEATISAVRRTLDLEPIHRTGFLVNTVSYDIRRGDVEKLESLPGVARVTLAARYEVGMFSAKEMTGVYEAWEAGQTGYTGKGMVIAVIDSGVNYLHEDMVQNPETAKYSKKDMETKIADLGYGKWFSDKVPFGYSYITGRNEVLNGTEIHGYHVSGICAANGDETNGGTAGVARDAQIFAMQVYDPVYGAGGYADDLICAIEDAVLLGADVINMSLGSDGGFYEDDRYTMAAVNAAQKAGVFVACSAGNSATSTDLRDYDTQIHNGWKLSDTATVSSASTAAGALSVASVEDEGCVTYKIDVTLARETRTIEGIRVSGGSLEAGEDVALFDAKAGGWSDFTAEAQGKIALVRYDGSGRFTEAAMQADNNGCTAVFFCCQSGVEIPYEISMQNAGYQTPVYVIGYEDGQALLQAMEAGETVSHSQSSRPIFGHLDTPDTASYFSSWGPAPSLEIKPEIAAPGGWVRSLGDGTSSHVIMSGTSMASPFMAGAAAVVKQYVQESGMEIENVPEFIRMTLMNTATPMENGETGVMYPVRQVGAGLVNVRAAVTNRVLVTHNGKAAVELLDQLGEETQAVLTLRNYGAEAVTYTLSASPVGTDYTDPATSLYTAMALEGASVTFDQSAVTVPAGGEAEVTMTLHLETIRRGHFAEGYVYFTSTEEGTPSLSLPFMGFMGDWDEEAIVDAPTLSEESVIKEYPIGYYYGAQGHGTHLATWTSYGTLYSLAEAPDGRLREGWSAFSPNGDNHYDWAFPMLGLLRDALYVRADVLDGAGNVLADLGTVSHQRKLLQKEYIHSYPLSSGEMFIGWDGYVIDQATGQWNIAPEGDYIIRLQSCVREGGDWQTVELPVAIDFTAPVIESLVAEQVGDYSVRVTLKAADAHGIGNDVVVSINGEMQMNCQGLTFWNYDAAQDTYSYTYNTGKELESVDGAIRVAVMISDTAGNVAFGYDDIPVEGSNKAGYGFLNLNLEGNTYVASSGNVEPFRILGYVPEGGRAEVGGVEAEVQGTSFHAELILDKAQTPVDAKIWDASGDVLLEGSTTIILDSQAPAMGRVQVGEGYNAVYTGTGYTILLDRDYPAGTQVPMLLDVTDDSSLEIHAADAYGEQTTIYPRDDGKVEFPVTLGGIGTEIAGRASLSIYDGVGNVGMVYVSVYTKSCAEAYAQAGEISTEPNYKPTFLNLGNYNYINGDVLQEDGSFRVYGYLFNAVDRITLNGKAATIDPESLNWYCDVPLDPGINTVVIDTHVNGAVIESDFVKISLANGAPQFTLDLPEETDGKIHMTEASTVIRGTITTLLDDGYVFINNVLVESAYGIGHSYGKDTTTRTFCYPVELQPGDNYFQIDVTNSSFLYDSVTVNLYLETACTHETTELRNAKEATCTEDGYTGDEVCTVCGEIMKQGEVIPAHCPSKAFADLNTDRWYHEYTDYVIARELMNGMDETHFAPEGSLTRGMLVTTLYRLAGEPEVAEAATFTDVKAGRYYAEAVAWAEDLGIAKGMTATAFQPEGTVTRQQAATFLYRYVTEYLKQEAVEGADLTAFADGGKVQDYAKTAMSWAVAEGFFEGYGDGTLRPRASLTRAQMAKLLTILD